MYYTVKLTFDYQATHLLQGRVNLLFNAYYEKELKPKTRASFCRGASASRRRPTRDMHLRESISKSVVPAFKVVTISDCYMALVDQVFRLCRLCIRTRIARIMRKAGLRRYLSVVYYTVKLTFDYQVTHLLQAMVNLKFNAYYEKLIRPTCSASLCRGASASRRLRKRRIISDDRFPYQLYPRSMRWLKTGVTWP